MIDPLSVLVAAVVFVAGWLAGRHARLKSAPKQPKPICMCGHHYGTHDPENGICQTQYVERFQERPTSGHKDIWVSCDCVRYTGPQPVEQYWVPPAADMNIVTAPRAIEREG